MSVFSVKLEGMDELKKRMLEMSNPQLMFDADYAKVSRQSSRRLIEVTPKSGHGNNTAKGWTIPKKLGLSSYVNENNIVTQASGGKRYSMITILDKGRKEVLPKNKYLFIPLTERARAKRSGAPIPKDWIRASTALENFDSADYLFAKKSKAVAAKNFIQPELDQSVKDLVLAISQRIKAVNGQ